MVIKNFIRRMLTKNPLVRKIKYLQKGGGKKKRYCKGPKFYEILCFFELIQCNVKNAYIPMDI